MSRRTVSLIFLAGLATAAASLPGPVPAQQVAQGIISDIIRDTIRAGQRSRARLRVKGSVGAVKVTKFTPDGKFLVTVSADSVVRMWDLSLGREVERLSGHSSAITAVAVSPGGERLATASEGGEIWIWGIASQDQPFGLAGHAGRVETVEFSPNGEFLISGGADRALQVWDAADGDLLFKTRAHDGAVTSALVTADGRFVISGSEDGRIRWWDVLKRKLFREITGSTGGVSALTLTADGRYLISGSRSGDVTVWKTADGRLVRHLKGHRGAISDLSVSRDGKHLASASEDGTVRLWRLSDGAERHLLRRHQAPVSAVSIAPNGRVVITGSHDGTARLWELATGRELARVVATKSGWAVIGSSGHFDSAEGRFDDVEWQQDNVVLGLEKFAEVYYEPGLLARFVAGQASRVLELARLEDGFAVPPVVSFISPKRNVSVNRPSIAVQVAATDQGGGIREIRLHANGKLVASRRYQGAAQLAEKEKGIHQTFQVPLVNGDNLIRLVGFSRDGIEGQVQEIRVTYEGGQLETTLHIVAIGLNKYLNPRLNLNYGRPDAWSIAQFLKTGTSVAGRFDRIALHEVFDEAATRNGILGTLEGLRQAKAQDTIVIYYAGHGEAVDGVWHMLPYDIPEVSDVAIRSVGISATQIQEQIRALSAQNVLLLIDSCKSGAVVSAFKGFETVKTLRNLAKRTGVHILAATDNEQFSAELKILKHGVFTYALLEGLNGQADFAPSDGFVAVTEIMEYVSERVPALIQQYELPIRQSPLSFSWGHDFRVAKRR